MIEVTISNCQSLLSLDHQQVASLVQSILRDEGFQRAEIDVAVVDSDTIARLNQRHLQHDYATDVLSFALDRTDDYLEGEVVVNAELAIERASRYGCRERDELLLYVVHGVLHLVGYDDSDGESTRTMRQRESVHLRRHGIHAPAVIDEAVTSAGHREGETEA